MVEPFRRCGNDVRIPGEPNAEPLLAGFGHSGKPLHRLLSHDADVDRFGAARARHRLEAGQPEEIIDEVPHPLAFLVDAREGAQIPFLIAWLRQRQRGLRLDHGQRRAQLVRGIGSEVHLSPAGLFDRRRHPTADGESTQKDDEEEHRSDQEFRLDQVRTCLVNAAHGLGDNRPVIPDTAALDPERGPGHAKGLRTGDACRRDRKLDRLRLGAAITEIAVGMPHPPEDRRITNVWASMGPGEAPGHRLPVRGHRREPLREGGVDVGGKVMRHDQHHANGDQQVHRGHNAGRRQRYPLGPRTNQIDPRDTQCPFTRPQFRSLFLSN